MSAALVIGLGLAGSAGAAADEPPGREGSVLGLIVLTSSGLVSDRSLGATAAQAGAEVSGARRITPTLGVVDFDQPLTPAEAASIAAAVEARPDVIAVGPNRRVYPLGTPDIPNDPLFGQQWDMWDGGGAADHGTRAAELWSTTKGSPDVVVGIIDTGVTSHPDLAGTMVPGFDFISDAGAARDGNRWDDDPSDEGDWCPEEGTKSTWHGTRVHGTVNAVQGNGIGISGLAPAVKVQHLRALGACGGETVDILSAVIWGSGGDVGAWWGAVPGQDPGTNPTPASVLNMSLGGEGECDAVTQQVFDAARARGTTIVVAAGNESTSVATSWPATCARVVAVASSTRSGTLSAFSNYGTSPGAIALSAPGTAIMSTINMGTTFPTTANYGFVSGTSMATPHVAAAAAIAYSLGITQPSDVIARLQLAVRPFPSGSGCDATRCGAGLLDASQVPPVKPITVPGAPTGLLARALNSTSASLQWVAPESDGGSAITAYAVRASRDGQAYVDMGRTKAAVTTYTVDGLTPGATYAFEVAAVNATGVGAYSTASAPIVLPTLTTPGQVSGFTTGRFVKTGKKYRVTVRWRAPADDGGSPVTGYRARLGLSGRWSSWSALDARAALLTDLRPGARYSLQVKAVNEAGAGRLKTYSVKVPSG